MAKERKVVFLMSLAVDPETERATKEFENRIKSIDAMVKRMGAGGRTPGGRRGGASGNSAGGGAGRTFSDGMSAAAYREEKTERDKNLQDLARSAEKEKKIVRDRLLANLQASAEWRAEAKKARAEAAKRQHAAGDMMAIINATPGKKDSSLKDEHAAHLRRLKEREQTEARTAAASARAWKEGRMAAQDATAAVSAYARGLVFLAASSEESAQKALQLIARFEAVASAVYGTQKAFEAATKARKAFQAWDGAALMGGNFGGAVGGGAAFGGLGAGAAAFAGAIAAVGLGLATALQQEAERIRQADAKFRNALEKNPNLNVDLEKLQRDARNGNPIAAARLGAAKDFMGRQNLIEQNAHDRQMQEWRAAFGNIDARHGLGIREGMSPEELRKRGLENGIGGNADQLRRLDEAMGRRNAAELMQQQFEQAFEDADKGGGLMRGANMGRALEGVKEANDLRLEGIRKVGEAELEILNTQRQAAAQAMETLKQRKAMIDNELKAAREARMDREELFGSKDAWERQRIIDVAKALREGREINQDEEDLIAPFMPQIARDKRRERFRKEDVDGALGFFFKADEFKAGARDRHAEENAARAAKNGNLPGGVKVLAPTVNNHFELKIELDKQFNAKIDSIKKGVQVSNARVAELLLRMQGVEDIQNAHRLRDGNKGL